MPAGEDDDDDARTRPPLVALFDALRGQAPATPIEDLDERRADADRTVMLIHTGPQDGVQVQDRTIEVECGQVASPVGCSAGGVRDDGERYLARLHEAGAAAVGVRVLAHAHATWLIPITATNRVVQDLHVAARRRIFAGTLVPG